MTSKQELLNTEQAEESLREEPSTQGHTEENRETFGKKAIEDLASQLNKAANTIRDFTQNVRSTTSTSICAYCLTTNRFTGVRRGDFEAFKRRPTLQVA